MYLVHLSSAQTFVNFLEMQISAYLRVLGNVSLTETEKLDVVG